MLSSFKILLIAIEFLVFVVGFGGNAFIASVMCAQWVKRKTIFLFDFLLACLAFSRMGMLCFLLGDSIRRVFCPEQFKTLQPVDTLLDFFWNLSNSLGMWCATCLSVFYLFKLSHFSHPYFLWMKQRRDKVIYTILLGFLLSLLAHLLSTSLSKFWMGDYLQVERNSSGKPEALKSQYISYQIFLNLGMIIPLFVMLVSFFMLIFFLWRHTQQMKHHARESGGFNIEVHVRARNTMISFTFLLVVHYVDTVLAIWSSSTQGNTLSVTITEMIALLYPAIHPFSLIWGNRRLKQHSVHLLRRAESCFKKR